MYVPLEFRSISPPPLVHYIHSKWGGGAFTLNSYKKSGVYAHAPLLCAHMHTATTQTVVYTSMVQAMGCAYTSLQITALQDIGAERGGGGVGVYSRVSLYSEFYSTCIMQDCM